MEIVIQGVEAGFKLFINGQVEFIATVLIGSMAWKIWEVSAEGAKWGD